MSSIRHLQFGGIRPAVSDKLLPAPFAKRAHNAKLRNGELCPFKTPKRLKDAEGAQHIHWLPETEELKCADGCITPYHDTICNGTSAAAVFLPSGPQKCGTGENIVPPAPTGSPTINSVAMGSATDENGPDSRTYVYTWVNACGYESPPSPPSQPVSTGAGAEVDLSFDIPPSDVVCVRLYRMTSALDNQYGSGETATSFQLVDELDAVSGFVDTYEQYEMVMGTLDTVADCPPPEMNCVMETEAGYLVGWKDNMVYFSEFGEPHNWPERYRYRLPHRIVGGTVSMNSVYLGTTGHPYRVDIAQPVGETEFAQIAVTRYKERAPLKSPDAITCTDFGAAMASIGGVWALDPSRARLATRGRVDECLWDDEYCPEIMEWHRGRLYGAGGPAGGFIMGWQGGDDALDIGDFVTIDWDPTAAHAGADGNLYYIQDDAVWQWDAGDECMEYTWSSAVTRTPGEIHWAAAKVVGDFSDDKTVTIEITNQECGLYDTQVVDENMIYRVPCHPRGIHWCVEITGTACICEFHLATSKAELTERGTGGENASDT